MIHDHKMNFIFQSQCNAYTHPNYTQTHTDTRTHLINFLKGVCLSRNPATECFPTHCSEPRRPSSSNLLPPQMFGQIAQPRIRLRSPPFAPRPLPPFTTTLLLLFLLTILNLYRNLTRAPRHSINLPLTLTTQNLLLLHLRDYPLRRLPANHTPHSSNLSSIHRHSQIPKQSIINTPINPI